MGATFEELLRAWDGESVHIAHDADLQAWFFICIHTRREGRAGGGIRMRHYADPAAALHDGLLLSSAMTLKMAICDAPLGGGKSVIAVPAQLDDARRTRVLDRYAQHLDALRGSYYGAPDVNTSEADMDHLATRTPYVFCRSVANGGSGSTAPGTALGVLHAMLATARHVLGSDDLAGRSVLIQGLGGVGGMLARLLHERGARLLVADVDIARVDAAVAAYGAVAVAVDDVASTACDIYAPCALGGVLDAVTIPQLRCRIVAGAANNQLATDEDDLRLRAAGICYAPDFVVNAGGVLHGIGLELWGWSEDDFAARVADLGETLLEVYRSADASGGGTHAAAMALARARTAARG